MKQGMKLDMSPEQNLDKPIQIRNTLDRRITNSHLVDRNHLANIFHLSHSSLIGTFKMIIEMLRMLSHHMMEARASNFQIINALPSGHKIIESIIISEEARKIVNPSKST